MSSSTILIEKGMLMRCIFPYKFHGDKESSHHRRSAVSLSSTYNTPVEPHAGWVVVACFWRRSFLSSKLGFAVHLE